MAKAPAGGGSGVRHERIDKLGRVSYTKGSQTKDAISHDDE